MTDTGAGGVEADVAQSVGEAVSEAVGEAVGEAGGVEANSAAAGVGAEGDRAGACKGGAESDVVEVVEVVDIDDPRLEVYRDLKVYLLYSFLCRVSLPTRSHRVCLVCLVAKAQKVDGRKAGRFVAEGPETIKVLLQSNFAVTSLFLKASVFERLRPDIEKVCPYGLHYSHHCHRL
jgi:hypothetical protein